jgi:hypothetical protein
MRYVLPLILFDCSALQAKRQILINFFKILNICFNIHSILNTKSETAIKIVISFILEAGHLYVLMCNR